MSEAALSPITRIGDYDPYNDTSATVRMRMYDELRDRGDVLFSERFGGFWILTRAELMREALQNPRLFSSTATVPAEPDPAYQWIPLMLDPPIHTDWRQLLSTYFSPHAISDLEPQVRACCRDLLTGLAPKGGCDFVADFARVYPTTIFMGLMGLPVEESVKFLAWEDAIVNYSTESDPDRSKMMKAMSDVREYFRGALELRRRQPRQDLMTTALTFRIDGDPVGEDDLLNLCLLLFMAGLDTVTQQLAYCFLHLAMHPVDRSRLVGDPSVIGSAMEEMLRYYSIVTVGRRVTEDVEFHGYPFKRGQIVFMPLTAASRDLDEFVQANDVDLVRSANRHMAFGAGPHRCLGSHLARRELRIALEEWHQEIPNYELAPGLDPGEIVEHSGGGVLGLSRLPLAWA